MWTLIRTVTSESGKYRVEIEQRSEAAYRLRLIKWTEEWVDGYGKVAEFWEDVSGSATFTDTLESAERLAAEKLMCIL